MPYLALTIALFLGASLAHASDFVMTGQGRVFYEPDAFDLSFGIVTDDPEIAACRDAHLAAVRAVSACLEEHRAAISSLRQDAARLETVFRNQERDRFLRFTTQYTIRVTDPDILLELQHALIASGVTDFYGIDFFSQSLPALQDQARRAAIRDAQAKALLAAEELGWTLTGATHIAFVENEYAKSQRASASYGSRAYAYDVDARPDQTTAVTSTVTVTFAFASNPPGDG